MLEPVVCIVLPKKEFSINYFFEEQGTSEKQTYSLFLYDFYQNYGPNAEILGRFKLDLWQFKPILDFGNYMIHIPIHTVHC